MRIRSRSWEAAFIYGGTPGQPVIPTDAYVLQGAAVIFVVTRTI